MEKPATSLFHKPVTCLYFILGTVHTKHSAKGFTDIFAFNSHIPVLQAGTILTPILQMKKLRFQHGT